MVGVGGVIAERKPTIESFHSSLAWTGAETCTSYRDDRFGLAGAFHRKRGARPDGDVIAWTWGNVYGFDGPDGYENYGGADSTSDERCVELYEEFGSEFVSSLNGTFAAVLYDRSEACVYLFTDRLGSRPIYYAETESGGVAFSTGVQSLVGHPNVSTGFDVDSLAEYFANARIPGTRTAFSGIEKLLPASITRIDVKTGERETTQYWQPRRRPSNRPFSSVVSEFAELFRTVLDERMDEDTRYGLLLSGGTDSRLILAATDQSPMTYNVADWESNEVKTAAKVADRSGVDFRVLERGGDYYDRLLERNSEMMNCYGTFEKGHLTNFIETLQEEVDVLISGLYSDVFFKALYADRHRIPLGPLGDCRLPIFDRIESVDELIERHAADAPDYLNATRDLDEMLSKRISATNGGVVYNGVEYQSLLEADLYAEAYPLSNDPDLFYYSLTQTMPHWTPFLDHRLIDFALTLPMNYQIRRNVIESTIAALDPDLASIPRAGGYTAPNHRPAVNYLLHKLNGAKELLVDDEGPEPYLSDGPWRNDPEFIRTTSFVPYRLYQKRELVETLPFLSWDGVVETYLDHLDGRDNTTALYSLLSFLEMPAVEQLAEETKRQESVLHSGI